MTSLLFGTVIAALLSATSLLTVLFRVSPITSPLQAVPAFIFSVFMTITTCGTLLLYALWKTIPTHDWDEGRVLSISLRQGIFIALASSLVMTFHILGLLNWWITILIYAVFVLIELALDH
jgi:hypothetical protein